MQYGPFTLAQLTTLTQKGSDSSDFVAASVASKSLASKPIAHPLYLLGTAETAMKHKQIIASTDFCYSASATGY